ncbi:anti-sigma-D factor RsdA [Mycobacterium sp. 2YAF39]|uniref:anti-sigma-D factor RsdA n=1 Tax=Mycobacterium sp. 2YAF39 TaxID=3233033 RepID=UPI003F9E57AE
MPDFGRWTSNGGDPSLNEINRSDRFLDALATEQQVYATDAGEAELINLLSGWRDEIREAPLMAPVTPRDAVIALDAAQRTRHSSRRTLALVGSTAAAVLCLGGFVSVVAGSGPGDSLYGLRTMIFGEQQATRDDAVMLASQQLAEVQQLVDSGQWDAAQQKLQTITTTVATVNDDVQKQELVSQWQDLTVKVDAKDAAATLPPDVPPPTFPEVVVLQTPTSSDITSAESTSPTSPTSSETTSPTSPTSPTSSATTTPVSGTTTSPSPGATSTTPPPATTTPPTSAPQQLPPVTTTLPPVTQTTVQQTVQPPTSEEVPPTVEAPPSTVVEEPPVSTTAVIEQQEAPRNVPTTAEEPATVEAPPTVQAPPTVREVPKTAVTTIIEAPAPAADPGS